MDDADQKKQASQQSSKDKRSFSPEDLRLILAITLFITVVIGGGLFYLRLSALKGKATEVNQALTDAAAKEKQISDLQTLRGQLAKSNELIAKADTMFTTSDAYQAQMLNDVRQYADTAGLSIASTSFESGSSHTMVVKLLSPASYDELLLFLQNIETNLPKLRVTSLTIGHDSGGKAGTVSIGDIKIEAAVR